MSFQFHPVATCFTLLGLAVLVALGTWQLDRHLDARQFEQRRDARIDRPVTPLDDLGGLADGEYDFRRVTADGTWDDARLFLIKHRVHDGDPGYWVVRPLVLKTGDGQSEASGPVLPVNIGWIPREDGPERARRMLESTPAGDVTVTGLVHHLREVVADQEFRDTLVDDSSPEGVVELDTYDIEAISESLPHRSVDRPVVLTKSPDDGDQPPVASHEHITDRYLTAEKHFGYMLTWYGLAAALIAIWFAHGLGILRSRSYGDAPRDDR